MGSTVVLGGGRFLMSEVPLYTRTPQGEKGYNGAGAYRVTSIIKKRDPPGTIIWP